MTTATAATGSDRIVIDSSGWLEYLTDDVNARQFALYVEEEFAVLVPTIVIYEVYKKLLAASGRLAADSFASEAARRTVLPLDEVAAIGAALTSTEHNLAMADAIVYASALSQSARLITGDAHFKGLDHVVLID